MKVLIAEDDAASRRIISTNLERWGYEVVATENGLDAWQVLSGEEAPSLAVLDWVMPELDGIEVCRRVRELAREPYTYVILLTSKGQKDEIVEGLECGADDYVVKPFHPHELRVRLRAGERIVSLQEQVIAARERLREMATKDALTSLLNRAAILDVLQKELSRSNRAGLPIHVCMLDLDHFKDINDTHGHVVGDAVLTEAAARMRGSIRSYDTVGRYGGEEFLIVLPGCDRDAASVVAERMRVRMSELPIETGSAAVNVTVSLGLASAGGRSSVTADALIKAADDALYEAKKAGRNRLVHTVLEPAPAARAKTT